MLSIIVTLILVFLAYFVKIESLTLVTNATIIILTILNVLANIFQLANFFESDLVPKTTESIGYKLGSEILTPLFNDVKKIKNNLEGLILRQIDLELARKKKEEYLFLKMREKLQESISNFYQNVEQYNALLGKSKTLIQDKISVKLYDHCQGVIVPTVDWETGEGFNSKFNNFCKEEAQKIHDEVLIVALRKDSVSSLQPSDLGILDSPLFNLLRKDSNFAFLVRSDDPEVIDEEAAKYSEKSAKSVFESIFKESYFQKIKDKRKKLIGEAEKLIERLDSEIRKTS